MIWQWNVTRMVRHFLFWLEQIVIKWKKKIATVWLLDSLTVGRKQDIWGAHLWLLSLAWPMMNDKLCRRRLKEWNHFLHYTSRKRLYTESEWKSTYADKNTNFNRKLIITVFDSHSSIAQSVFDCRYPIWICEILGPAVQSIVSLTTSLRRQLVKYMPTKLSNTLLFFVGKM